MTAMKHTTMHVLALSLLLLFGGCRMFWEDYGDEGQSCADDGSCRSGLVCQAGICLRPPADGDRDMVGDTDPDPDVTDMDSDDPPVETEEKEPQTDGDVDTDSDADPPLDSDPDIIDADGTIDFGPGTIVRSFAAPGSACRGLALHSDTLWVGDMTNNTYIQLQLSTGIEARRIDIPLTSLKDFDVFDLKLYAAFNTGSPEIHIVDLENSIPSNAIPRTYGTFKGLTFRGNDLITWEGNTVKKRAVADQSEQGVYVCNEGGELLTHAGDVYYSYLESSFDGSRFTVRIQKMDANHAVNVTTLATYDIPIDAQKVTGLDARDDRLYILTGGSGTQADRIYEIQWK